MKYFHIVGAVLLGTASVICLSLAQPKTNSSKDYSTATKVGSSKPAKSKALTKKQTSSLSSSSRPLPFLYGFKLLKPVFGKGLQEGQIPLTPEECKQWQATGLDAKLVYALSADEGNSSNALSSHPTIISQDVTPSAPAGSSDAQSISVGTPSSNQTFVCYPPQINPASNSILLPIGTGGDVNAFSFYSFDFQTGKLKLFFDDQLANPDYGFSPDGSKFYCLDGGSRDGWNQVLPDFNAGPTSLVILDSQTSKKEIVARGEGFLSSTVCSWAQNSFFYNAFSPSYSLDLANPQTLYVPNVTSDSTQAQLQRSAIYEYNLTTHGSRLVAEDGYRPVASPNGQWIVFYGSESSNQQYSFGPERQYKAGNTALSIMRADGTGRRALDRETSFYSEVSWLPDSKHFVSLQTTDPGPNLTGIVWLWNAETATREKIAQIVIPQSKVANFSFPSFFKPQVSPDGRYFFIESGQDTGRGKGLFHEGQRFIYCIDIQKKTAFICARFKRYAMTDWRIVGTEHNSVSAST